MKPAAFEYHRPREIDAALALLREIGEDGKILAGGQSLMPLMNFRLAQPGHLIDINFIEDKDYIKRENGTIKIGCLARQSGVLEHALIRQGCPLIAEALAYVGYEQTRNRGTFCGSLAHADPAAELPAVLCALNGSLLVGSLGGTREIDAGDFFQSYLTTALASDEMILEASIPEQPPRAGASFMKLARRFGDFAIVGVAVLIAADGEKIGDVRIALTGVADVPWRDATIERSLVGAQASAELFRQAAKDVAAILHPSSDIHASADYRRSLAVVLTRRALADAWSKTQRK